MAADTAHRAAPQRPAGPRAGQPALRRHRGLAMLGLVALLSACAGLPPQDPPSVSLRPVPPSAQPGPAPSARSERLRMHFEEVERDLLAQGLLRRDGGGPDTPYDSADLAENFEKIAFYDEITPGGGLQPGAATAGVLRRWQTPVRVDISFGPSVSDSQRRADSATISGFAARLARLSGHPMAMADPAVRATAGPARADTGSDAGSDAGGNASGANFHVLVMGADDSAALLQQLDLLLPGLSSATRSTLTHLPDDIHCLVLGFAAPEDNSLYARAITLIRAEEPQLTRQACVHEEMAQGLGLRNDSPTARPSIFNDDNEFALLTSHDEKLLEMLYDPRLQPGMRVEEARPLVWQIAAELMGETPS